MSNLVVRAAQFASMMHEDQTRVDGSPYIEHPMRVAGIVATLPTRFLPVPLTDKMLAATWLHDIYEDTGLCPPDLSMLFGDEVGIMVEELTNYYTKDTYPELNRADRKEREVKRLAKVWPEAQIIKLCDRIDNLRSIRDKGAGFAMIYCDESEALTKALGVSTWLQARVYETIEEVRNES